MEGRFPENWLSLKPINSSEVGGGEEEEDDGKVILELRLRSNSSDQGSPKPFDHPRPMNTSSETAVIENRTSTSFLSEKEETTCPVCFKSFRSKKAMHGHMRCHPNRGWRGANPPPALPPPSSIMSASSPPPIWGVRGKRGQKSSISNSSKKLKMDGKGASSGSTDEENYDSWKEFLTLGLNYGEEKEKEKESEMKKKEKEEEASSSSSTSVVEEKEKEEGHKCKICKKSFLTGQALGGHQTTHRRKSAQLVFQEAQYCKTMTS